MYTIHITDFQGIELDPIIMDANLPKAIKKYNQLSMKAEYKKVELKNGVISLACCETIKRYKL